MLTKLVHINRMNRAVLALVNSRRLLSQVGDSRQHDEVRLKGYLQNNKTSIRELVDVYHNLAVEKTRSSLLGLTEEKILNLLVENSSEEDDMITKYLPKKHLYDYNSLCHLFIELAGVRRRPTPLLKAASNVLLKSPYPGQIELKLDTVTDTLEALVKLNYTNRPLVSKLINDITDSMNLEEVGVTTQCKLLRSLGSLKWRHESLMHCFYLYVRKHHEDHSRVTHNLILTLLYVTAALNYRPKMDIGEFYMSYMAGPIEENVERSTRKWLGYVWSLAVLGIAQKHHIESVLNDEYIIGIQNPIGMQRFNHGDIMKLLNLRSIAGVEMLLLKKKSRLINELDNQQRIQRGSNMETLATRVKNAMTSFNYSDNKFRFDIHTSHGFCVDCEFRVDNNLEFLPLDDRTTLEDELNLAETMSLPVDSLEKKCAMIYLSFDEVLANYPEEPVAHKKIASRILERAGYRTIFLPDAILSREKTSADFLNRIKEIIRKSLSE